MTKVRFEQRPAGDATMSPEMLNATNYYNWIISQLSSDLGQNVLDIGGGFGSHLEPILRTGHHVLSIDLAETSAQYMRDRFASFPAFEAMAVDFGHDSVQDMLIARKFDTITCLNVLEHIENDVDALKDMHMILKEQQGTLLLLIPAHEWLYGTLDSLAGHYRRYSATYLRQVLTEAQFEICSLYHFNFFGVLPWFINARILRQRSLAANNFNAQIKLFDRYFVPVLQRVESHIKFPVGQSLIAIAKATR